MSNPVRPVSTVHFVMVGELLEKAFPKGAATPDHLAHHCERAEQALLSSIGRSALTTDETLARLLGVSHVVASAD